MKIENRIKALENDNNDSNKRAALNGEDWALTDEQRQKRMMKLVAKLFAVDISGLPGERVKEIEALRARYTVLQSGKN